MTAAGRAPHASVRGAGSVGHGAGACAHPGLLGLSGCVVVSLRPALAALGPGQCGQLRSSGPSAGGCSALLPKGAWDCGRSRSHPVG